MSLIDEYRERAAAAGREARAATLKGVRDRFLHAEATWLAAAERVERSLARKAERDLRARL